MISTGTPASFSEALVAENADLWQDMADHPWVEALAAGKLEDWALINWAGQDRLFAQEEESALGILRAVEPPPPPALDTVFRSMLMDTEREPRELAETLDLLGAEVAEEPWPMGLGYSSYLVRCAHSGLLEGTVALFTERRAYLDTWSAVLPSADGRWRSWVENWSGDGFRASVAELGQCLDDLAGDPPLAMRSRLSKIARRVARYELEFWDMAWTGASHRAMLRSRP